MHPMKPDLKRVYDILVLLGGAHEDDRESFLYYHAEGNRAPEWRFQGVLGFGGKYRAERNRVDCYREDEDYVISGKTRKQHVEAINAALSKIAEVCFTSNARWPDGLVPHPNNVTSDTHDSLAHAEGVCNRLREEGFGGDGKVFPLTCWTGIVVPK